MSEEGKNEKPICANCKHKLLGWRCAKNFNINYVNGRKSFGTCVDKRHGGCYCEDFKSKKAGGDKTADQLTISENISYIITVACATFVILGFFGMLVALVIWGR